MFDVLKGILMLLVTLAHTNGFVGLVAGRTDGGGLFQIYSLPPIVAFFMISGYTSRPECSWTEYLKRQAKGLLIPYFLVPVVSVLFRLVLYSAAGRDTYSWAVSIPLGFLWGATHPMELLSLPVDGVGAMWFLPTLFLGGALHQALMRISRARLRAALLWGIVLVAACVPSELAIRLPWFVVQSCTCLGYLELGRLMKARKLLYIRMRPAGTAAIVGTAIVLGVLFHTCSGASLWANVWTFGPLDYFGSALIALVLFRLYLKTGLAVSRLAQPLADIGRSSLHFLTLHGLELVALPWGTYAVELFSAIGLPDWGLLLLIWVIRSGAVLAGCAVISLVQRHLRRHLVRTR